MTDALRDLHFDMTTGMPTTTSAECDNRNTTIRPDVVFVEFDEDDDDGNEEIESSTNYNETEFKLSEELKSKLREYNRSAYLLNNSSSNVSF